MPRRWLLLLCLAALPLFFEGLCHRSFTDNEGMYAEVGREILLTGDWLTPRINGTVYLNKPPLVFWLTALALKVGGLNELPRLISGLATLGTMLLLFDLGRLIWPGRAGVGAWAAAVFLSSALTSIEARVLRPDSLLMFLIVLTLWGAARVSRSLDAPGRWGQGGMTATGAIWGGIGLGVMVKGLLGLLLPALAFVPALLLARRARDLHRYCAGWGLLLAAAIVLPWHVAVGVVNRGFWWDYIVNQHFLYFFDRKFPHDSVSHPLWFAWAAFAGRLLPWVLLLPAALLSQLRRAQSEQSVAGWLPLTWFGMVWLFFSVSKGRLEHYFLPAVPAAALLVGRLCDEWASGDQARHFGFWILDFGLGRRSQRRRRSGSVGLRRQSKIQNPKSKIRLWRALPFAVLSLTATVFLLIAPAMMRQGGFLRLMPGLLPVSCAAFSTVALGAGVATLLALGQRHSLALGLLVATFLLFGALAAQGMDATDPLVSARQGIDQISPALLARSELVYEPGEEYQLCGGLNFYLRRRLLLLEPPGFIPPTYLEGHVDELFVKPDQFWSEWRQGRRRFLLFMDPSQHPDRSAELSRSSFVVGRGGDRLILTNLPFRK